MLTVDDPFDEDAYMRHLDRRDPELVEFDHEMDIGKCLKDIVRSMVLL